MKKAKHKKRHTFPKTLETFRRLFGSYENCPIYKQKTLCLQWGCPEVEDTCFDCPKLSIVDKDELNKYARLKEEEQERERDEWYEAPDWATKNPKRRIS